MPNGHGIPLGCFVCKHYQKGKHNPLMGRCQYYEIEVNMDLVCSNFDNAVNSVRHKPVLAEGVLYAYVDVIGYGYPPPTELVPLAQISEYKGWDEKQREKGWADADEQARIMFEQRK